MRKLAVVLLIVMASASYADKVKSKDKRFEPVVKTATEYAGSYRGPSESYGLILEMAPNGQLRGSYVEMGHVAVLNGIKVDGADFTARASFDDGTLRTITGSFANRILNGKTAFGARLNGVYVEDVGAIDTFFERVN